MGFQTLARPRPTAQGENKRVVRWDLMRPHLFKPPEPAKPREPEPPKLTWKQEALAELPKEVSDLAICKGRYWKNKSLATLRRDYADRERINAEVPAFVRRMADAIAKRHGVPAFLLFGKTRVRRVAIARQELCFALRQLGLKNGKPPSLLKIAAWVGLKDHTSVLNALRAVQERRAA